MPELHVFTNARCPNKAAAEAIAAYLWKKTPNAWSPATITLRVPVGDLKLTHDVLVIARTVPGYPGYEIIDISWEPKGEGPYPIFSGKLSLEDEGPCCRLNLDGEYWPPLGPAGEAFDAVFGHRIAEATGKDFVEHMRDVVERTNPST